MIQSREVRGREIERLDDKFEWPVRVHYHFCYHYHRCETIRPIPQSAKWPGEGEASRRRRRVAAAAAAAAAGLSCERAIQLGTRIIREKSVAPPASRQF